MPALLSRLLGSNLGAPARRGIRALRSRLVPPTPVLQPERLYLYLDVLWHTRRLEGAVVEVGCYRGGTTLMASKFIERIGSPRPYLAIDTFAGFDAAQFEADAKHGTATSLRAAFSDNSLEHVRSSLDRHGGQHVQLLQGDIVNLPEAALPASISVALIDVDLDVPVYEGLRRLFPRLQRGGVMLVDDCPEHTAWAGARIGYLRFVKEHGLQERYVFGTGIVAAPGAAGLAVGDVETVGRDHGQIAAPRDASAERAAADLPSNS
jgi:O-methyltransferase